MPKGATRAKRPKKPFSCPDGQRLPDGYSPANAVAKEFYNTPKGQKRAKKRKLLPSLRWRGTKCRRGALLAFASALPFLALLQETAKSIIDNPFIFNTLNTVMAKLLFTDSSFCTKVLFIFSNSVQCKISLKISLILHLTDKYLIDNTLQLYFNFKFARKREFLKLKCSCF